MPYLNYHIFNRYKSSLHFFANSFLSTQLQRITVPPPDVHAEPTPASTVAFDTQQELLWVGNEYVGVLYCKMSQDYEH